MHRGIYGAAATLAAMLALTGCGGSSSGGSHTPSTTQQSPGPSSPAGPAAGTGKKATATVGKTVYFSGYKLEVKSLTYTPQSAADMSMKPNLVLQATVTNLDDQSHILSTTGMEIDAASGNHHWRGELPTELTIPGKASSDTTIGFSVDSNFSVDNAVVTFGSADQTQTTLPLGETGELVANVPSEVHPGAPIKVTSKDVPGTSFTVTVTGGSVQSDYPGEFKPASKGQRVLVLNYDVSLTSDNKDALESFSYGDLSITQQGGDTVSAYDSSSAKYTVANNLKPGETKHFIAEFVINAPAAGSAYTLNVKVEDTSVGLGGSSSKVFAGQGPLQLS